MSYFIRRGSLLLRHKIRVSPYSGTQAECQDISACLRYGSSFLPRLFRSQNRDLHSTASVWQGAASKLNEAPADDIDPTKPADYNPANFDPTEARSPPSDKILKIVDEIANLTLVEASDLSYLLKKKLGLPDSAMPYYGGGGMVGGGGAGGGAAPAAEEEKKQEKTNFDIRLEKFDASSKIKVIKEIRTFTDLGLKEAKELVEKLPAVLKRGVPKEEAEQLIEKLKGVGATAVLE